METRLPPSSDEEDQLALFIPKLSEPCTACFSLFVRRHWQIFDFLFFASSLAVEQDKKRIVAARALADGGSEEYKKLLEEVEKTKNITLDKLRSFNKFISQAMIIGLVDNFLCYLSEIIQVCMVSRPDVLKSSEQVKIEEILKLSSMDEIVEFLVEKKINELSYGGVNELNKFCRDRLGLSIWELGEERDLLTIAIELRNICSHNRGIVNSIFLKRIMDASHRFKFEKSKQFHASFDELVLLANNMMVVAQRLDKQASKKFSIDLNNSHQRNT